MASKMSDIIDHRNFITETAKIYAISEDSVRIFFELHDYIESLAFYADLEMETILQGEY